MPARGLDGLERLGQLAQSGDGLSLTPSGRWCSGSWELIEVEVPLGAARQTRPGFRRGPFRRDACVGSSTARGTACTRRCAGSERLPPSLTSINALTTLRRLTSNPPYSCQAEPASASVDSSSATSLISERMPRSRLPSSSATASAVATSRRCQVPRKSVSHMVAFAALVASVRTMLEVFGHGLLEQVQRPAADPRVPRAGCAEGSSGRSPWPWPSSLHASSMRTSTSRSCLTQVAVSSASRCGLNPLAISASTAASSPGSWSATAQTARSTQRRPDHEVHQEPDDHADGGVQQATDQDVGLEDRVGRRVRRSRSSRSWSTRHAASGACPRGTRSGAWCPCRAPRRRTTDRSPRPAGPPRTSPRPAGHRARRCGRWSSAPPERPPTGQGTADPARAPGPPPPTRSPRRGRPSRSAAGRPRAPGRASDGSLGCCGRHDAPP